jgi:hypothetical protein
MKGKSVIKTSEVVLNVPPLRFYTESSRVPDQQRQGFANQDAGSKPETR